MTETTPRREATKHRLVLAAITEFAARGIDATSVEQLSEAAGFSRGAFYSNFSTKDDLCIAILEYHRDLVIDALGRAFSEPPVDAQVAWATGEALGEFFQIIAPSDDFGITLLEIQLRSRRSPELAGRAEAIASGFRPELVRFMEQLAAGFQVRFRLPTLDLINVFEGMYFHLGTRGTRSMERLIGPLVEAISVPLEEPDD